ncbi:MAG TPA: hypothetical protein VNA04_11070 [Thermoanaerobaculia bacterium]|nr:hypothetical protein [Thermoanaerobaculia bacterium]
MKKVLLPALLVLLAVPAFADAERDPVRKVEPSKVCMINEQYMNQEQIPVEIDEKTYYGCCQMCVDRLNTDEKSRFAVDPMTKKKVDKAKAVIGALADGRVFYFENEKSLAAYNAMLKTQG